MKIAGKNIDAVSFAAGLAVGAVAAHAVDQIADLVKPIAAQVKSMLGLAAAPTKDGK